MLRTPEKGGIGTLTLSLPYGKIFTHKPRTARIPEVESKNTVSGSLGHVQIFPGYPAQHLNHVQEYGPRHTQLRKPGARKSARYVEVGGSGGNGRRQPAAPGRGTAKSSAVAGWSL